MEFKDLQNKMTRSLMRYGQANGIRVDDDYILLKLYEEVGEIAQAALIYKKRCRKEVLLSKDDAKKKMSEEMTDAVGIILALASSLNIDIEKTIKEKWIDEWLDKEF